MEREFFLSEGECNIFHQKNVMVVLISCCCLLIHIGCLINAYNGKDSQIYEKTRQQAITKSDTKRVTTKTPFVPKVTPTVYKVTAYCPCIQCCGKSDGITASGTKALAGRTIAVDPQVIPLGSKVLIGGKTFVAEDIGGSVKGRRIDMFFATHREALQFGVQNLPVVVVGRT